MSKIVDIHGNPFDFDDELQSENESKLAWMTSRYQEHPSVSLSPMKVAQLLLEAEQGNIGSQSDLAEDMEEKDGHLFSEIAKRRNAIQEVDWQIVPPRNATAAEQQDAEMLDEILRDATWLDDCIFDATDAILKGYSCQEIEWEPNLVGGLKLIKTVHFRDSAWFMTPTNYRNTLRLRDGSVDGIDMQPFGWIKHIAKSKTGYLSRIGLVRTLVWPYLYKNFSTRDFAEFLEIYGLPLRLGKYPDGATEKEKNTLLRAVMGIGHNAGGVIPRGMEIEFQNAANGNSEPFMTMVSWAEKTMSKAILGGTLTSQADGKTSTNALGSVHNDVRKEIRNADLKRLQATLNRDLIYPLYALNGKSFNDVRRLPRIEFNIAESADTSSFADGIGKLVDIGFKIPAAWAHEQVQIPVADKNDEILVRQAQGFGSTMLSAQTGKKDKLAILSVQPDPDELLDKLEPTAEEYQAIIDPMLKPIITALEQEGYEAAQEKIAVLYAELDDKGLEDMLTRAIFVSDMLGRLNVNI